MFFICVPRSTNASGHRRCLATKLDSSVHLPWVFRIHLPIFFSALTSRVCRKRAQLKKYGARSSLTSEVSTSFHSLGKIELRKAKTVQTRFTRFQDASDAVCKVDSMTLTPEFNSSARSTIFNITPTLILERSGLLSPREARYPIGRVQTPA